MKLEFVYLLVATTSVVISESSTPTVFNNSTTTSTSSLSLRGTGQRKLASTISNNRFFRKDIPIHEVPFVASAFESNEYVELTSDSFGVCDRGQSVDAQYTQDPVCQQVDACHLGWTESGESVTYYFDILVPGGGDGDGVSDKVIDYYFTESWVDITLRLASFKEGRLVKIIFDETIEAVGINGPGLGWQTFQDLTRTNIRLPYRQQDTKNNDSSQHRVDIIFEDGAVNLCSVSLKVSRQVPFIAPALEFNARYEAMPYDFLGNDPECSSRSPVDAQITHDDICNNRDGSFCNIGWTAPREWIDYTFIVAVSDYYIVSARIASYSSNRRIRLAVTGPLTNQNPIPSRDKEISAPGRGWQEFDDVQFDSVYLDQPGLYQLQVTFIDGGVNLCSVQVRHAN